MYFFFIYKHDNDGKAKHALELIDSANTFPNITIIFEEKWVKLYKLDK